MQRVIDDLRSLPEFAALNEWANAKPSLSLMYQNNDEEDIRSIAHVWLLLAARTLAGSTGAEPERRAFMRQFRLLLAELHRPQARIRSVVVIEGLDLDVERIVLDDATAVVGLPSVRHLTEHLLDGQFGDEDIRLPEQTALSALVTNRRLLKQKFLSVRGSLRLRPIEHVSKLLALEDVVRLQGLGVIGRGPEFVLQVAAYPLLEPFSWELSRRFGGEPLSSQHLRRVRLGRSATRKAVRLWREFMEIGDYRHPPWHANLDNRLQVAVNRFRNSYNHEVSFTENVVDLTIALEALFGPKGTQELTHRLRSRAAFVLGHTEEDTERIHRRIGMMYQLRSGVVHGRTLSGRDARKWLTGFIGQDVLMRLGGDRIWQGGIFQVWELALEIARELVRRSILGCLRLARRESTAIVTWPFPDNFDVQIVMPKGKRTWQREFSRAARA